MALRTNNNKNFNNKYFLLWFKLNLSSDGEQTKLGVLWIQSWKRRYLVIGNVESNGIAKQIGLERGDRLGYLNGIIAPKIKDVEQIIIQPKQSQNTICLGILRKHNQQTLIMADWIINNNHSKLPAHRCLENDDNHYGDDVKKTKISQNETKPKQLVNFFVSRSDYHSMKDPDIYKLHELKKQPMEDWSMLANSTFWPRDDQQSTPNTHKSVLESTYIVKNNEDNLSFIRNKENYHPIFQNSPSYQCNNSLPKDELRKILKQYELSSSVIMDDDKKYIQYKKTYYKNIPEKVVKQTIDSHVKQQRALRTIQ